MVAFGGAGPLHAARLARRVGVPQVIIPNGAGVGSAVGLLQATPRIDTTATRVVRLDQSGAIEGIAALYEDLEQQALSELGRLSAHGAPRWSRYAQMRYAGQGFEIHVDLPDGPIDEDYSARVIEAFSRAYLQKNKFIDEDGVVEGVDWTLVGTLPLETAYVAGNAQGPSGQSEVSVSRPVWFPEAGGHVETRVIALSDLGVDDRVQGPAIIEDAHCTIVVPPGDRAGTSGDGHLIIDIARDA
jgi:N-methylhydantoinase A/oxoprolinase/acetone carboxylase beta subunit